MKECTCEGTGHTPWCRIYLVTERDRLMGELREANDWRDKLADKIIEVERDRDSLRQQIRELTEENERLRRDRDSYANSNFEGQLSEARAENERLRGEHDSASTREALIEALKYDERIWRAYQLLKPVHRDGLLDALERALVASLRSDLSAALVSVDAMAERIGELLPVCREAALYCSPYGTDASDLDGAVERLLGVPVDSLTMRDIDTALAHTAREQEKGEK